MYVLPDCCKDRADSVCKAFAWYKSFLLKPVLVPALNKWTKVAPSIRHISVMQNFCNLVPQAFEASFHTSKMVPEAPDEAEEEGADVGAPLNETKLWGPIGQATFGEGWGLPTE